MPTTGIEMIPQSNKRPVAELTASLSQTHVALEVFANS